MKNKNSVNITVVEKKFQTEYIDLKLDIQLKKNLFSSEKDKTNLQKFNFYLSKYIF